MNTPLTKEDIQKIREIPITRLLNLRDTGRRIQIRCPFHKDKTPSCAVYPDNSYHCFACGAHGNNAIDFVMGLGSSFNEAVNELKAYM